ncbi:MAG: glycosyltransferase family 87 protein [bacterium]
MAHLLKLWRWFSPVNRWLLAFALLNSVVVHFVLLKTSSYPILTSVSYTKGFLTQEAYDDSWTPMRKALAYLDSPGEQLLYDRIFFERKVKFQYPPTSLLVIDGLRRIDKDLARENGLNAISWFVVWATAFLNALVYFRLAQEERRSQRVLGAALAAVFTLTFYPVLRSYCLGQIQTWITCLVALMAWLCLHGHGRGAGVAAGLMALIKPQLSLLLVWALLRRRWGFAAAWAVTVGLGLALSIGLYGWANHVDYLRVLLYMARHGEVYFPNQSVNGLLNRLLGNGESMVWDAHGFAPYNVWVHIGTTVSSLALIAAALWPRPVAEGDARSGAIDLLTAVLSFTIASPIAWEHHYGVMVTMFCVALPVTLARADRWGWGIALLAASFFVSAHFFQTVDRFAGTPWNFLQSYLFFGAVLLLVQLHRLRYPLPINH